MFRSVADSRSIDLLPSLFAEERGHPDRPWLMLDMVTSIDGATAVGGGASGLNDPDDRKFFLTLRATADVVLTGAATARAENLGPIRMSAAMSSHRAGSGLSPFPRLVVLTRSFELPLDHRMFSEPAQRPMLVGPDEAADLHRPRFESVADVVGVDTGDAAAVLSAIGSPRVVLCEGGPDVNSLFATAGLVDEVNLTIAPTLAMGDSKRLLVGDELDPPTEMALRRVWRGDRSLFLRYLRSDGPEEAAQG